MRRALVACLGVLLIASTDASAIEPLHVEDGTLLDGRGRQVVLHGVNVVYKVAPYHPNEEHGVRSSFNEEDARRLRDWGFNAIRLGVQWAGLEPQRGQVATGYIEELRRIVRLAARHGLYSMPDVHQDGWGEKYGGNGAPEWATYDDGLPWVPGLGHPAEYGNPAVGRAFTSFWQDREGIQTRYIESFAALAAALKDEPGVLGYDTFNEPSCEYTRDPCAFPPPPHAAGELLHPFYDRIVPALQAAHPGATVYYEDWITASSGEYSVGEPPNPPLAHRDQLGLSYHVYCASGDCEEGDGETIRRAERNAKANNAFPLITEFGATDDLSTIERVARLADAAGHSWLYWTYKTYFDPYPIFLFPPALARAGGQADSWSIVAEDGRVKQEKVLTLARPYPRAIAGRQPTWSFDPETKAFELSYTPSGEGITEVVTNAGLQYPKGYRVAVEGAVIESTPAAEVLRLKACPGASKVSVKLTPSGHTSESVCPSVGCLARRAPIGPRNIGRVRLGRTRRGTLSAVRPQPVRRTQRAFQWCIKRSRGRVTAVFSRRGRALLVTTNAPAHGNRGVRPGSPAHKLRRTFPGRSALARGVVRAFPGSARLIGVRRGRVRYFAVADRRLLRRPRRLRAALGRAGLR